MSASHTLNHQKFLAPPGKTIRLNDYATDNTAGFENKSSAKEALLEDVSALATAQELLWASKEYALVIILQALDAAGKDGIIKHVMSGVNPQGVSVYSFKAPTEEERLHHFLWRPLLKIPLRGMIAIFNRSYYEEVLVVRVHPEFLDNQWLPRSLREADRSCLWQSRYNDINAFEKTMTEQNIRFLKFFLHLSKKEQRKRFLKRLEDPEKTWKFSARDIYERQFWTEYQQAYEDMLNATSTDDAPWYIIPADKKWFARALMADIIVSHIKSLKLQYPKVSDKERAALEEAKRKLESEPDD